MNSTIKTNAKVAEELKQPNQSSDTKNADILQTKSRLIISLN
jgi:hypothetical protein